MELVKNIKNNNREINYKEEYKRLILELEEKKILVSRLEKQIYTLFSVMKSNTVNNELKGEALEKIVFKELIKNNTSDTIVEVKRGVRGVDIHQTINEITSGVGEIFIECKRTKNFSNKWIDKLKKKLDNQQNAYGVIVYEGNANISNSYTEDNILVCTLNDLVAIISVLRKVLIFNHRNTTFNINNKVKYIKKGLREDIKYMVELIQKNQQEITKEKAYFENKWDSRSIDLNSMIDKMFFIEEKLLNE